MIEENSFHNRIFRGPAQERHNMALRKKDTHKYGPAQERHAQILPCARKTRATKIRMSMLMSI